MTIKLEIVDLDLSHFTIRANEPVRIEVRPDEHENVCAYVYQGFDDSGEQLIGTFEANLGPLNSDWEVNAPQPPKLEVITNPNPPDPMKPGKVVLERAAQLQEVLETHGLDIGSLTTALWLCLDGIPQTQWTLGQIRALEVLTELIQHAPRHKENGGFKTREFSSRSVAVEIRGGKAEVTHKSTGFQVVVVDHDQADPVVSTWNDSDKVDNLSPEAENAIVKKLTGEEDEDG